MIGLTGATTFARGDFDRYDLDESGRARAMAHACLRADPIALLEILHRAESDEEVRFWRHRWQRMLASDTHHDGSELDHVDTMTLDPWLIGDSRRIVLFIALLEETTTTGTPTRLKSTVQFLLDRFGDRDEVRAALEDKLNRVARLMDQMKRAT